MIWVTIIAQLYRWAISASSKTLFVCLMILRALSGALFHMRFIKLYLRGGAYVLWRVYEMPILQ